jgi:hypothetical protein
MTTTAEPVSQETAPAGEPGKPCTVHQRPPFERTFRFSPCKQWPECQSCGAAKMRICADCVYFLAKDKYHLCTHPLARDIVTGRPIACHSMRSGSTCGDKGALFAHRPASDGIGD